MAWTYVQDYIVLGIDSILVGIFYTLYKKKDKIIQNLLNANSVAVGPALEDLLLEKGDLPYVSIRGRICEIGQKIESPTGLKGVLQVITLNEHSVRRHGFGHWGDSVRTIKQSQNSVPFALKNLNESKGNILVEIENPFEALLENLLLTVSTNFTPTNSSVTSTIVGFVTGVASKGIESTEEFLPIDTVVTGVGQLVSSGKGKYKLMQPQANDRPFILSTYPIESIIKKMEARNNLLKLITFVLLTVGVFITARRFNEWFKKYRERKMREKILKKRTEVDLEGLTENTRCIICLENPREVILLDCGHVCVCYDCCSKLNDMCPVCRNPISSTHAAYIA